MCKKLALRTVIATTLFAVGCGDGDVVNIPNGAPIIRTSWAALNEVCTTQRSLSVVLPADDAPHTLQSTEEWYYNMHLTTKGGAQYAVRLAFFQNATQLAPFAESVATLDVTDLAGVHPRFVSDTISLAGSAFPLTQAGFSLAMSDKTHRDSADGNDGSDHVTGQLVGYAFDVQLEAQKPAVLHGDHGLLPFPLGDDHYYSRTRMDVAGTLTLASGAEQVTGIAWFDHQYGVSPTVSWLWFSVQLDDGRDLMVYQWNEPAGLVDYLSVTLAGANCGQQTFDQSQVTLTNLSTWTSPQSGIAYGNAWQLEIPAEGLLLQIKPYVESSEIVRTTAEGGPYVEGDCEITGSERQQQLHGVGFVEQLVLPKTL